MNKDYFKVCVRSFTYNHACYIEEAMNGFCMQQTNFPYVCTIVDDASTDGEQEVIKKYLLEHFDLNDTSIVRKEETDDYVLTFARHKTNLSCYFAVFYLKYNHYGNPTLKQRKFHYIAEWLENVKYIAMCEGDDYWTDPQKLQMQYDYLESHPKCTMTCHRAKLYSEQRKRHIGEQYCRNSDGELKPVDIINRTGLYIPTCSLMFRPEIKKNYPEYCQNCNVGDYPLQITAAMKGTVYYFDKIMGVYRIENINSWAGHQKFNTIDDARIHIVYSQVQMFKGFAMDYPQYRSVLENKISEHIIKNMPYNGSSDEIKRYFGLLGFNQKQFKPKWFFYLMISRFPIPKIRGVYNIVVLKRFRQLKVLY